MLLHNATRSSGAPLQYPQNVVVGDEFPRTKMDLLYLTGKPVTISRLDVHASDALHCENQEGLAPFSVAFSIRPMLYLEFGIV